MREYLFRGKRIDNGQWIYGYYIKATHHWHNHGVHEDWIATDTVQNGGWCNVRGKYAVSPETIGQYTGLTDKNGKKIFEGDIVHLTDVRYDNEWKAVVTFGNPYCQYGWGWNLQYIGKKPQINTDILLWVEMEDVQVYCEVIGNIHDNPELLGGEL